MDPLTRLYLREAGLTFDAESVAATSVVPLTQTALVVPI
jgi:hypothetical protein